jgi:diaminohydroxyphosphoribosylaminopyrimidine deaminase / 5-amino-6-(5-phosphoribosylamino)uracil reductase
MNRRQKTDAFYLKEALKLAARARGRTSPNPMVGALVVRNGRVMGRGFHHRAGTPHAEVIALSAAGSRARGATLYLNLEPCCHTKKRTPPCVEAIIQGGIRRVVACTTDPNSHVRGRGFRDLRKAGIRVSVGLLEAESKRLNESYMKYIVRRVPFVILKAGMTLDGKIGSPSGRLRITGPQSQRAAHELRDQADAIVVGLGTVLSDNPKLTTRLPGKRGRDPRRIVLDRLARTPLKARVLSQRFPGSTVIAVTRKAPMNRIRALKAKGATVLVLPEKAGRVSLRHLMAELGRIGISSVLIEGGAKVNASALADGLVDKVVVFLAPTVLGGKASVPLVAGDFSWKKKRGIPLRDLRCRLLGRDVMIEGYL